MKSEFEEYLKSVGLKKTLITRVEEIIEFFEETFSKEISDIFVEEYIKQDGSREYESIQFFSDKAVFQAKNFIVIDEDDFTVCRLKNNIQYFTFIKEDYDLKETSNDSRFCIRFSTTEGIFYELKSSKENCNKLKKIFITYLKPNFEL